MKGGRGNAAEAGRCGSKRVEQTITDPLALAGAFVVRDPGWRRKLLVGGLLMLLVNAVGWPVALGYRKALIGRLLHGTDRPLPDWSEGILHYYLDGLKALGVIFGYLSPVYLTLAIVLRWHGVAIDGTVILGVCFFLVCPLLSPASFPAAVAYWTFFSSGFRLPPTLAAALMLTCGAIVFFIPAGFLQVSKTGRYLAAFDIPAAAATIVANPSGYVKAWYHSVLISFVGHAALPLAPWGIVWCYLGIIFIFNSLLERDAAVCGNGSWYGRLRGGDAIRIVETGSRRFVRCVNCPDDSGRPPILLVLGGLLVPMPDILSRLFVTEGDRCGPRL